MKPLCLVLAVICLLMCTGCGDTPAVSTPPPEDSSTAPVKPDSLSALALAYSHDDTLDPFATKTEVNLQLAGLLYDSLTVLDAAFEPQLSLAEAITAPDPTHLTVTLRKGAAFSDGSPVRVQDVVASFQQAKASPNYKELLSRVTAAAGDEKKRQVTFSFASPDRHGAACLSFPVVKEGTSTKEKGKAPVGGGAYVYEVADGNARLKANPRYKPTPHFPTVELRHLPNSPALYYAFAGEDITYYFNDLNTGEIPRVTGANKVVDMNALLFVGVNSHHKQLSNPVVRQALSQMLDRPAVVSSVYKEWGVASQLPFHPRWKPVSQLHIPSAVRDLDSGIRGLEAAGCKAGTGGVRLELELIYSTDSKDKGAVVQLLRSQLAGGGVTIKPVPLSYKDYMARLKAGKFDLYLGEVRLAANHSLRPLLAGGTAGYGVAHNSPVAAAYDKYQKGEGDLQAFLNVFARELPYIPVCWRSGVASYDRRLTAVTPTGYAPYYGLPAWN